MGVPVALTAVARTAQCTADEACYVVVIHYQHRLVLQAQATVTTLHLGESFTDHPAQVTKAAQIVKSRQFRQAVPPGEPHLQIR
jgi:hypothetical protein